MRARRISSFHHFLDHTDAPTHSDEALGKQTIHWNEAVLLGVSCYDMAWDARFFKREGLSASVAGEFCLAVLDFSYVIISSLQLLHPVRLRQYYDHVRIQDLHITQGMHIRCMGDNKYGGGRAVGNPFRQCSHLLCTAIITCLTLLSI